MTIMKFEEFAEKITEDILSYLPEEFKTSKVGLRKVTKNNDVVLTGLDITQEGSVITPTIHLESFYEKYIEGMSLEEILERIADLRVQTDVKTLGFDPDEIAEFDKVRDKIFPKLVNKDFNKTKLQDLVYTEFSETEDLAVIYAIEANVKTDAGMGSITITKQIFDRWDISLEELDRIAKENIAGTEKFQTLREAMIEMYGGVDLGIIPEEETPWMYFLSNKSRINGSNVILNTQVLDEVAEKVGDFIIIPSSIHEVLIVPRNEETDTSALNDMVNDVNTSTVSKDEWLSDKVYTYDPSTKKVTVAA